MAETVKVRVAVLAYGPHEVHIDLTATEDGMQQLRRLDAAGRFEGVVYMKAMDFIVPLPTEPEVAASVEGEGHG